MVNFKENYHFFKVSEGVQHFPGGSNCLVPIETHITCDFPGGVRTPCPPPPPPPPPLDPHLAAGIHKVSMIVYKDSDQN